MIQSAANFNNVSSHLLNVHKAFWEDPKKDYTQLDGVLEIFPFVTALCNKIGSMSVREGCIVQKAFAETLSETWMAQLWSSNACKQTVQEYMQDLPWSTLSDWEDALKKEKVAVPTLPPKQAQELSKKGEDVEDALIYKCVNALEKHYSSNHPDGYMQCYGSKEGSNAYRTLVRGHTWVQSFVKLPGLQDYIPQRETNRKKKK